MKAMNKLFKRRKKKPEVRESPAAGKLAIPSPKPPSENLPDSRLHHRRNQALPQESNGVTPTNDTALPGHLESESDSDDSLIVSDEYKGVSSSFKGLTNTTRFAVEDFRSSMSENPTRLDHAYDAIEKLEQTKLARGGISIETKAVGRVQFGIPPETIKDSMVQGLPVPQVYIVPSDRFCREMGPALGVNLAEFEFPAYFNFFVYKKRCTLVVDSPDARDNICRVFSETLLGPEQFRRRENPIAYEEEDFAPDFPRAAIPNFQKELEYFRIMPDGKELELDTLLNFCLFEKPSDGYSHNNLGVPPSVGITNEDENIGKESGSMTESVEDETVSKTSKNDDSMWPYKKGCWVGDVATVWPANATEEQKKKRNVPRVEIFKMPSGSEYIIHDIDENNQIVGKARFAGYVTVSESMSVEGFNGKSILDDPKTTSDAYEASEDAPDDDSYNSTEFKESPMVAMAPPTFHPPSFGVTILGNSHGFDKSGSVSGYVLWINGRGVMIDPPPYSSATLEREGIRPRTIVGIILTHCHADHDAGAFQKVLTGSPVVVITTPTIYKSFIRKYAALSSLSPALLQHSHRYKPAIIGQPLRFQGAAFSFTYSLHTIPCVGFRVEWRGRSMVFTGDHMNKPAGIDQLQQDGVLSKARADDLRNLPLQEADLLLHEAGAPPIHTPLEVLMKLPERVKKRLYVVHTASIPEDCDLRTAPIGTAGTLRLDQVQRGPNSFDGIGTSIYRNTRKQRNTRDAYSISLEDDEILPSPWSSASNEYVSNEEDAIEAVRMSSIGSSFNLGSGIKKTGYRSSLIGVGGSSVPLVSLRPASSTDAWFILNLLSAVPFLSSLSYTSTMEVLEAARVDAYCKNDVVVPISRRSHLLCVIWEGTCVERNRSRTKMKQGDQALSAIDEANGEEGADCSQNGAVWHAGDWTGPIALQPDKRLSGESDLSRSHDIVAMSTEGVKVITVEFSSLHLILKSGSALYRKYLDRTLQQKRHLSLEVNSEASTNSAATHKLLTTALKKLNIIELLDQNSALGKLAAVQKRHLESLAEGPIGFGPGERLWRVGAPVDKAFLVVAGNASFVPQRRNAGSASVCRVSLGTQNLLSRLGSSSSVGEDMQKDVTLAIEELGDISEEDVVEKDKGGQVELEKLFSRSSDGQFRSMSEAQDLIKLSRRLQERAVQVVGVASEVSADSLLDDNGSVESDDAEESSSTSRRGLLARSTSAKARFANKVLGRLYTRKAFTGGLMFSRGHFLGDVSKMVAGLLAADSFDSSSSSESFSEHGFSSRSEVFNKSLSSLAGMTIEEEIAEENEIVHTSTLTAGRDGCVVLVFTKASLIPFLDGNPGLLLSLLGTQVVI